MRFLYPLGLWGLIGIPILIIIYIIKNKHTEQTVSSTYLWTLSERFLKRKNPISKLKGIISLILQCLTVLVLSFAIAHPVFILPGQAYEYCFILDGSGSMNMTQDGKTRFELGKQEIVSRIESSKNGSIYSVVYAGDTTTVVVDRSEDKEETILKIAEMKSSYTPNAHTDALEFAQELFNENPGLKTYLITDKSYETHENVEIVNLSGGEENYAVSGLSYTHAGIDLTIAGSAISYESDAELTVEAFVNDISVGTQTVSVKKGEAKSFTFTHQTETVGSVKAVVTDADALPLDNESIVYNVESENSYKTLIVSDEPFFFKSIVKSIGYTDIEVLGTEDYEGQSGYGLYIFDSFDPGTMPSDGTVWLFNLSSAPEAAGFATQGEVELDEADVLQYTDSSASLAKKLLENVLQSDITITKYQKYSPYRNFTTLLSYKGNPIVFVGSNTYGHREVVFAFDLNNSNFPVMLDFVVLAENLLAYSFPDVLEKVSYACGESLEINVVANCESIRVDSPLQNTTYLDTNSVMSEFVLDEVGVYTITMTVSGVERYFHVYASLPETERVPTAAATEELGLYGKASSKGLDGKYDNLFLVFIGLAVIFLADWAVYCHDKYQLR